MDVFCVKIPYMNEHPVNNLLGPSVMLQKTNIYSTQKGFVFFTLIFSDNKSLNICSKINFVGAQFFIDVNILGKVVNTMGMSLHYRLFQLKNFVKTMKLQVVGT